MLRFIPETLAGGIKKILENSKVFNEKIILGDISNQSLNLLLFPVNADSIYKNFPV